jgi:hypothetical protein
MLLWIMTTTKGDNMQDSNFKLHNLYWNIEVDARAYNLFPHSESLLTHYDLLIQYNIRRILAMKLESMMQNIEVK